MDEIWKDIKGYEGRYRISNIGRVLCVERVQKWGKRHIKERVLTPKKKGKKNPYLTIILYDNSGKDKTYHIHRLVALHFVEGYFSGADVNHKDGNKSNNVYTNLEWCTRSENQLHSKYVLGNKIGWEKGIPGPNPKKIIQLTQAGEFIKEWPSITEAARIIGCNERLIRDCVNDNHHWRITQGSKWIDAKVYYSSIDKSVFSGITNRRKIGKVITQYTTDGRKVQSFNSVREAVLKTGCSLSRITKCARENKGSSGGYIWRYDEEQPILTKEKYRNKKYKICL